MLIQSVVKLIQAYTLPDYREAEKGGAKGAAGKYLERQSRGRGLSLRKLAPFGLVLHDSNNHHAKHSPSKNRRKLHAFNRGVFPVFTGGDTGCPRLRTCFSGKAAVLKDEGYATME